MESNDQVIRLTLTIKGSNLADVQSKVINRIGTKLNEWFAEDLGCDGPFPDGSLLLWSMSPSPQDAY